MSQQISRRLFLALTGTGLAAFSGLGAAEAVPAELDHIILGCSDLDRGIAYVEERAGVRAAYGGAHPGRGTRNALLSLGTLHYLEVMAPDPAQDTKGVKWLLSMTEPRIVGWAVHPGDLAAYAKRLRDAGVPFEGPVDGSRARPEGRVLRWKALNLKDNPQHLLPFFIEWAPDSPHPSSDAPAGCRLAQFWLRSPDPTDLQHALRRLGVNVTVERGDKPQLRARITGPKGEVELTS